MRTLTSIVAMIGLLIGCEKDVIDMRRRDTGVVPDSGIGGPLPLQPGMAFVYQATLTYRSDAVAEETSLYMLKVTIAAVDDQGPEGDSTLTFTSTGANRLDDDFQATSEFDLWVARLGPSQDTDLIDPTAVTETLTDPPAIPPPPSPPPKRLPQAGSFFIDVRAIDRIGQQFTEAHQSESPQVVPPSPGAESWTFSYAGMDPTIFYLTNKMRSMRLEYSESGWLTRIDETIGDPNFPPSANARLMLMSGP
jgi:hypothetical protein